MGKFFIEDSNLTNIANAIRSKTQQVNKLRASAFSDEIAKILTYTVEFKTLVDGTIVNIELADDVSAIKKYAFYNCNYLMLSKLPTGITSIGDFAFYNCSKLTITEIPAGVTSIGEYAFYNCTGLTTITFKGTPTSLNSYAFSRCTGIKTINVPWASGAVSGAPWGATNATINYNYKG